VEDVKDYTFSYIGSVYRLSQLSRVFFGALTTEATHAGQHGRSGLQFGAGGRTAAGLVDQRRARGGRRRLQLTDGHRCRQRNGAVPPAAGHGLEPLPRRRPLQPASLSASHCPDAAVAAAARTGVGAGRRRRRRAALHRRPLSVELRLVFVLVFDDVAQPDVDIQERRRPHEQVGIVAHVRKLHHFAPKISAFSFHFLHVMQVLICNDSTIVLFRLGHEQMNG